MAGCAMLQTASRLSIAPLLRAQVSRHAEVASWQVVPGCRLVAGCATVCRTVGLGRGGIRRVRRGSVAGSVRVARRRTALLSGSEERARGTEESQADSRSRGRAQEAEAERKGAMVSRAGTRCRGYAGCAGPAARAQGSVTTGSRLFPTATRFARQKRNGYLLARATADRCWW